MIALIMLLCIGLVCWLYVDGKQLPLPDGDSITGYVTRLDIGFDESEHTATHNTVSFAMTDEQIDALLQLLQASSYRRTRYGNSVSFDGDVTYTISLAYQDNGRNRRVMISVLDDELINLLVDSDTSSGYLKILDPDFLPRLQKILEH